MKRLIVDLIGHDRRGWSGIVRAAFELEGAVA
jgi:hypothetical protein